MFFSPIDEFEIHPVVYMIFYRFSFFIPINFTFFFIFFIILYFCSIVMTKSFLFNKNVFEFIFEEFYLFINRILIQNYKLNAEFAIFFPFFLFLFFFILFVNLLGIVPGGFTNTAFILHNFLITASIILGITIMGFLSLGFKTYISFFVLKGLPFIALCFLFILEVISHTAKAFSLSIRLFANMTAGHTLMHILAGGLANILKLPFFGIVGLIPFSVFVLVCLMELGISILQAYVFFILIVIYFNEGIQTSQYQSLKSVYVYGPRLAPLKDDAVYLGVEEPKWIVIEGDGVYREPEQSKDSGENDSEKRNSEDEKENSEGHKGHDEHFKTKTKNTNTHTQTHTHKHTVKKNG